MDYLLPAAQSEHLTPLQMLIYPEDEAWYLDWRWNVQIQLLLNLHGKLFHYLPKYKCQKSLYLNIMKHENWTIINFDFSMAVVSHLRSVYPKFTPSSLKPPPMQ